MCILLSRRQEFPPDPAVPVRLAHTQCADVEQGALVGGEREREQGKVLCVHVNERVDRCVWVSACVCVCRCRRRCRRG